LFAKKLLGAGALVTATALIGAAASKDAQSRWYRKLRKPDFQPPREAFPVVWPVLYGTIALSSAGVLSAHEGEKKDRARGYRGALLANLVLNAGWSWTFFKKHDLDLAFGNAVGLAVSSTDLARRAGRVHRGLGLLLLPYAAWCWFATLLTSSIRTLNR